MFLQSSSVIKYKLVELQSLAIYWDSNVSLIGNLESKDLEVRSNKGQLFSIFFVLLLLHISCFYRIITQLVPLVFMIFSANLTTGGRYDIRILGI